MLKRLLFFTIIFSSCLHTSGQKFNAGIFSGLAISQVDGDHLSGFNKAGIRAGGFVNRKIGEKVHLQFEISFIQKGSRMPLTKDGVFYLMRLNYIEVPLLFKYTIATKWIIEAGPAFATLVSAFEEDQLGEISIAPPFHRNDYLACAGANYFMSGHLFFNVRYSYSIASIRNSSDNNNYYYSSGKQYNKVLTFSLAYQF